MATKKLVLDAGHGLKTPGKETPDKIKEFTLNQKVVDFIIENLKNYDVTIDLAHDKTGETDVSVASRRDNCNKYAPDVFVSIHHNALTGSWGTATGTEVLYYSDNCLKAKNLANIIAPKLAANTGLKNRGIKPRTDLTVLTCKAPAVLTEGGFMDTESDHAIITSETGQKAYAKAVSDSLIEYLDLTETGSGGSTTPSPNDENPFKIGDYSGWVETTADLNVRTARNANADLITTLPNGTKIQVGFILYENDQNSGVSLWGGVNVSGKQGFIHLGFVKAISAPAPVQYYTKPIITTLLTVTLTAMNVDSSFAHREKIAKTNNIAHYTGTDEQNTKMFDLLKAGLLIKA